jgi:metallo-beta-lactamase class B
MKRTFARRAIALVATSLALSSVAVSTELPEPFASWNRPIEPFGIADNLYYVGASDISAFLITTPAGHILLDGGFEETAPIIRRNVEALGFNLDEIEIILNSHAHGDHAGGLARLVEWTGARLVASHGDAPLLESGGEAALRFPPVRVDRSIDDGDTVELGGVRLTAHVTAGHTPGCTTWTTMVEVAGTKRATVFVCSVNALPEMDLLTPDPAYPDGRATAFEASFERLEALPCELFLGPHGSFFRLDAKRGEIQSNKSNPFVDPDLCRRHLEAKREQFEQELARQRDAAATRN